MVAKKVSTFSLLSIRYVYVYSNMIFQKLNSPYSLLGYIVYIGSRQLFVCKIRDVFMYQVQE